VGFSICTCTTSLTFDLTSDQERYPAIEKNTFTGQKGRNLQQSNRGGSLSRIGTEPIDVMYTDEQRDRITTHSMNMTSF